MLFIQTENTLAEKENKNLKMIKRFAQGNLCVELKVPKCWLRLSINSIHIFRMADFSNKIKAYLGLSHHIRSLAHLGFLPHHQNSISSFAYPIKLSFITKTPNANYKAFFPTTHVQPCLQFNYNIS